MTASSDGWILFLDQRLVCGASSSACTHGNWRSSCALGLRIEQFASGRSFRENLTARRDLELLYVESSYSRQAVFVIVAQRSEAS